MNLFDIIAIAIIAIAVAWGFYDGFIRQLGTFVGVIVGIILAKAFGDDLASLLGMTGRYANVWGYIIIFVLCLIGVGLIAYALRKIVKATGLGFLDRFAGGLLSLVKCVLILAVVLALFDITNNALDIVSQRKLNESKLYHPLVEASHYIVPAISWVDEQLP